MFKKSTFTSFILIIAICSTALGVYSCKQRSLAGMIVMSQSKSDIGEADVSADNWRYMPNSRIVALDPNTPEEPLQVLTSDFYSACAPKISYDGEFMLFAAQKNQNDIWQIWEMNLSNLKKRQITTSKEDCIDPDYLPGERLVFSKQTNMKVPTNKTAYTLYTCNLDGSNLSQITFDPSTYWASTILNDGRLVAIGRELIPEEKDAKYMIMRPDGTKQQLFYQSETGNSVHSHVWEMSNGKIVFIESDSDGNKDIASINYNRPLHSRENLTSKMAGDFYAISPYQDSKVLASYRSNKEEGYALYEFDIKNHELGKLMYNDGDYQVLEAVVVEKRERPKHLPSEVDLNIKTALLVCQDINFPYPEQSDSTLLANKANRLEIIGIDSTLGTFKTEEDGSFYLKISADTPFRMQSIDEDNNVVSGPSNWLYLRPNERRGCVGCHENRELVPKNVQPLAVRKDPILVPSPESLENHKNVLKE